MCYGVQARKEMTLRIAKTRGDQAAVERLEREFAMDPALNLHFANAFDHPRMVLYTGEAPHEPQLFTWGLVPGWVKDDTQRQQLWNQTLNARGESVFDKPSFRDAARGRRAVLFVEGFYEHFHFGKRTYPFFINLKDRPWFALAALWAEWRDPDVGALLRSFSIVTTEANGLMRRIHNKPGAQGPRMPVILAPEEEALWLDTKLVRDEAGLQPLLRPFPDGAMQAHAVRPLLGKDGTGNRAGASDGYEYPELALAGP
ncbi:MAG TPA: SOS response-associated peptidase [Flavobacteriales bacterium]|nr:SOS response-associated peptidase [Flavobacteriales bacterium]